MRDTLQRLAALHPSITQLDSSMRSFQNRPLYCLKISDNPQTSEDEPQAFFNGATHAREPLSTHTCVAFASLLCAEYGTDSLATWLVDNREIYFVPVMNPDGYVYNSDSGGASSNWRKNRRGPVPPSIGIDLNRNYGYKWGYDNSGSSPNPSFDTYRGPNRFSEPEVEAIHQFERQHRFRAQADFHTFGRLNMYPWCYVGDAPPEQALLQEIVDTFAVNNGYESGQWYSVLYPSNGTSVDWEFADTLDQGVQKFISYAFSCELGINDFWYGAQDSAYIHSEIRLNLPNCFYLTRLCGVWLEPLGMTVNDSSGNNNGELDPGERANLWFEIQNRALHALDTAQAVTAVLVPADTVIQVLTPSATFPSMSRRTSANNRASQIQVRCSPNAQQGDTVNLRLEVTFNDAGVSITQPLAFRLVLGTNPVAVGSHKPQAAGLKLRARPNPAGSSVTFDISLASQYPGVLHVYSQSGRLVRMLSVRGDKGSAVWNGADESGQRVAPGVYFARLGCTGRGSTRTRSDGSVVRVVLTGR
jgi:hypothetical protein